MTLDEARELFAYNKWANDQMLASLDPLTNDQLSRPLGSSFPTILHTAAHVAAAEWIWLSRWHGRNPRAMPEWAAAPERGAVRSTFAELESERAAYLDTLVDADLARVVAFTLLSGTPDAHPLRVQIQHVVNHGTYHRGQIATMVRQVGGTPIGTDLIRWARERTI